MASGHRKRYAALFRTYVLNPLNLSNSAGGDLGNVGNQRSLSLYSSGGYAPTFTNASPTQLSNAVSNTDEVFTLAGLTGEVGNTGTFISSSLSGAIGLTATAKHYYFPRAGTVQSDYSSSNAPNSPIIIYTTDGPQSSYVPAYLGATAGTGAIVLGSQITGSGVPTHISVYVAGELQTGDQIRLLDFTGSVLPSLFATGSDTSFATLSSTSATASAAQLSAALYRKAFLIPTGAVANGMIVEFSSAAKTSTTPVKGAFVVIASSSYT